MKRAIGLIELKSIPVGIETADEMLKAANVDLVMANPICPGKYMILITGDVGAVKSAIESGKRVANIFLVESHVINNIHEDVLVSLTGFNEVENIKSIGAIETISALTAIKAGDIAVKASNVQLMEIRVAKGLGGKGFLLLTGEVSAVKSAIKSCLNDLEESGAIISTSVISSPHRSLVEKLR